MINNPYRSIYCQDFPWKDNQRVYTRLSDSSCTVLLPLADHIRRQWYKDGEECSQGGLVLS